MTAHQFRVGDVVRAEGPRVFRVLKVTSRGRPCSVQEMGTRDAYVFHDQFNEWHEVHWTLIHRQKKKNIVGALDNEEEE